MTRHTTSANRAVLMSVCLLSLGLPPSIEAYSSYGLGNISCKDYLTRRGEDQENSSLDNTSYIHAYLSGYLTAGNMMKGLVGDEANDVSINIHRITQWLDAKCAQRRGAKVAVALEEFWVEAANAKALLQDKRNSSDDQ